MSRKSGFWAPGNFFLWNPESWALEFGIQLKESGTLLKIGIQNPNFTNNDRNPVPGMQNLGRGIQNPRLSFTWGNSSLSVFPTAVTKTKNALPISMAEWIEIFRIAFTEKDKRHSWKFLNKKQGTLGNVVQIHVCRLLQTWLLALTDLRALS